MRNSVNSYRTLFAPADERQLNIIGVDRLIDLEHYAHVSIYLGPLTADAFWSSLAGLPVSARYLWFPLDTFGSHCVMFGAKDHSYIIFDVLVWEIFFLAFERKLPDKGL